MATLATTRSAATDRTATAATSAAHTARTTGAAMAGHTMAGNPAMAAVADQTPGQTGAAGARAARGVAGLTAPANSAAGHDHTPGLAHDPSDGHGHGRGRAEGRGRRGRKPVAGGLADRLVGEFIAFCSVALLMIGVGRWLARLGLATTAGAGGLAPGAAQNQIPGPISIQQFLSNVQVLIFGVLGTLTVTLFLVGFARWIAAHEPEEYEAAKKSLKNSAKGFVGALLSTTFVQILQSLVQGQGR